MSRTKFTPKFNLKVVLEVLKERHSLSELSEKYELHVQQISKWKNDFIEQAEVLDFLTIVDSTINNWRSKYFKHSEKAFSGH